MQIILDAQWRVSFEQVITNFINELLEERILLGLQFNRKVAEHVQWGLSVGTELGRLSANQALRVVDGPNIVNNKTGKISPKVRATIDTGFGFNAELLMFNLGPQFAIVGVLIKASEWMRVAKKANYKIEMAMGGVTPMDPIFTIWYYDDINKSKKINLVEIPPMYVGTCDLTKTRFRLGEGSAVGLSLFGTDSISTMDYVTKNNVGFVDFWNM